MVTRKQWPVLLFWLPFGEPSVSFCLGPTSSSFLLSKRRLRHSKTGCFAAIDVKGEPRDPPHDRKEKKWETIIPLPEGEKDVEPVHCINRARLRRKAKDLVRFFEIELGLKRARALPSRIECGYLRSAIRRCFDHLTEADELSIKTSQKVETFYCKFCNSEVVQNRKVEEWKKERFTGSQVDNDHLSVFAAAIGRNVPQGWNLGKAWPYVPNGHATAYSDRTEGGNWNEEPLTDVISIASIVSSGKPRIVTAYSGGLTETLFPLHKALYATLSRKGWLLRGEPTPEKVTSLNGKGEYVSVDYKSATDNIKTTYTRAAVEVLIAKGDGLTDEQVWALRTVGLLTLDGKPATRGQPMGSMMSFPLLCLINKTCVDLALNDLLSDGEISFKEWTSHRCLINGDDLLLKSPTHQGDLTFLPRLVWHGGQVGLVVNKEKTMVRTDLAEINSTLFHVGENGAVREKKSNAGIYRSKDVSDVIGYADGATQTDEGFLRAVRLLTPQLRLQERKAPVRPLSLRRWRLLLREARVNPSVKDALTTVVEVEPLGNAFPVVARPEGYSLSSEGEKAAIDQRVSELRRKGYKGEGACGFMSKVFFTNPLIRSGELCRVIVQGSTSLRKALGRRKPRIQDNVLKVLADAWEMTQKERLVGEDDASVDEVLPEHVCDMCAHRSTIERMSCEIKAYKQRKIGIKDDVVIRHGLVEQDDFVSF